MYAGRPPALPCRSRRTRCADPLTAEADRNGLRRVGRDKRLESGSAQQYRQYDNSATFVVQAMNGYLCSIAEQDWSPWPNSSLLTLRTDCRPILSTTRLPEEAEETKKALPLQDGLRVSIRLPVRRIRRSHRRSRPTSSPGCGFTTPSSSPRWTVGLVITPLRPADRDVVVLAVGAVFLRQLDRPALDAIDDADLLAAGRNHVHVFLSACARTPQAA